MRRHEGRRRGGKEVAAGGKGEEERRRWRGRGGEEAAAARARGIWEGGGGWIFQQPGSVGGVDLENFSPSTRLLYIYMGIPCG